MTSHFLTACEPKTIIGMAGGLPTDGTAELDQYPLGDSNPCYRTENPGSWATRRRGLSGSAIMAIAGQAVNRPRHRLKPDPAN